MSLLNKLTIKNLKLNKKRTVVTIVGVILSVALITAVSTMYFSLISSLIRFETNEKGNFHVSFYEVPVEELRTLKNNRSIENVYITKNLGYARLEESKNEYKPYAYIKEFTKDSLENLSIKLKEGRFPQNSQEIVIPTHLKTNGRMNLKVGDEITLEVGERVIGEDSLTQFNPFIEGEEIIHTTSKTYKIVGIIERPASNIETYTAPGYTFISCAREDLSGDLDIYVRYSKENLKNHFKVTANILGIDEEIFEKVNSGKYIPSSDSSYFEEIDKAKYSYSINQYLIDLETNPIKNSSISGLGTVVMIVCLIIVFTSIFCIKNSFDISITEKIKQYGMLRSIGATKKQIKKNVFYEATILGSIGIPLGIISGLFASYILVIVCNYFMGEIFQNRIDLQFTLSILSIFIAIVLGIVTIYLSAIRSAKKASLISPIESIRNSANIKMNSKKLKSLKIIHKLFGIGGDISYKNLKRNKKKYRTTVISIIVSVTIFIALSSFMSLAFMTVDRELSVSESNIVLSIDGTESDLYEQALKTQELDFIEDITIYRSVSYFIENPKYNQKYIDIVHLEDYDEGYSNIIAIGELEYKNYIQSLGLDYDDIKDKGILVDIQNISTYDEQKNGMIHYSKREYDYKKGDSISGKIEGDQDCNLQIGFVTDQKPFGLKYDYTSMLILSDEMYDSMNLSNRRMSIYYKSSNANKLQDQIDELLKGYEYTLSNSEENVHIMESLYTLIGIFLYGFIVVISLIGITNIFNTITTNMNLRKQEFAMLKSIGMTNQEFKRMIRLESIFMGTKSLLFGIPLGLLLSYIIYHFLSEGGRFDYPFPFLAILISIIAVFLLITCIMKYSIHKINKQNTIETIRNENI